MLRCCWPLGPVQSRHVATGVELLGLDCVGLLACLHACHGPEHATIEPTVTPVATADPVQTQRTVTGTVVGPNGAPVVGAVVAINDVEGHPLSIVATSQDGRFEAERPSERFAITVTSEVGVAAFVPPAATETVAPVDIKLAPAEQGFVIEGALSVSAGKPPAGALIGAGRQSQDEGDIFVAPIAESGTFTMRVPPGTYGLRPVGEELLAGWTNAAGAAGDRAKVQIEASLRQPAPAGAVRWLSDNALPIETTDVAAPTQDLESVAALLARARIIGIGEATHGTREFFQLKHRLVDRLASHHGLTLLAMEANFNTAERVDAWVRGGPGTVEEAMKALFVVWRTEEIRELLLWMRTRNAGKKRREQIGFRGYDVQGTDASLTALRTYLTKVEPSKASDLLDGLAPLDPAKNDNKSEFGMLVLGEAEATATQQAIERLGEQLRSSRRRYVARSSRSEFELMLQHARLLEQARARFAAKGSRAQFAARDRAMAENVLWLADQLPDDERVLVWAHNGHIQVDSSNLLGTGMGTHLRRERGDDYVAVGFVLDEGSYRAWVEPNAPVIADVVVGPRKVGWAAEALARVGLPIFAVDLRTAPQGAAHDWLWSPRVMHSCGWLVSEGEREGTVDVLGRLFDIAIYVGKTSSARQLGAVVKQAPDAPSQ